MLTFGELLEYFIADQNIRENITIKFKKDGMMDIIIADDVSEYKRPWHFTQMNEENRSEFIIRASSALNKKGVTIDLEQLNKEEK